MKNGISTVFAILAMLWCTGSFAQVTGSDRDKHGCIGSAGYQWSELKKECVQLFEAGTPFEAYGKNMDSSLAAYVIVSKDLKKAEVFTTAKYFKTAVILKAVDKAKNSKSSTLFENKKEKIKIDKTKDKYLIVINGEPVYAQEYSPTEGLGALLKKK